ncbi:YtxH domain-containing protein [Lactobacillus sp.]|uniref:YtxH domain-containing protein n=1 Tax=Lactobacillus sp. TaxID=1591 RepID=UPI003F021337
MRNFKHFGLGFLLGAAAGTVFAFLPDENGKSTRDYLKEDAEDFKEGHKELQDGLSRAQEASSRLASELPAAEQMVSDLNTDVDRFKQEADEEIARLQAKIDKLSSELNQDLNESEN